MGDLNLQNSGRRSSVFLQKTIGVFGASPNRKPHQSANKDNLSVKSEPKQVFTNRLVGAIFKTEEKRNIYTLSSVEGGGNKVLLDRDGS